MDIKTSQISSGQRSHDDIIQVLLTFPGSPGYTSKPEAPYWKLLMLLWPSYHRHSLCPWLLVVFL